jgi:hypothetical protein
MRDMKEMLCYYVPPDDYDADLKTAATTNSNWGDRKRI